MKIFMTCLILLLFSCEFNSQDTEAPRTADIKTNLGDMASLIPVINAGLSLSYESEVPSASVVSGEAVRALSPVDVPTTPESNNTIMTDFFGADWTTAPRSPEEVYSLKLGATDTSSLRIPSEGTISGIYNSFNDFYLELTPVDRAEGIFRVQLYIYPLRDFNTEYVYEEYLVDSDISSGTSWAWEHMNNQFQPQSWVTQKVFYRDGTSGRKSTTWSGSSVLLDEVKLLAPTSFSDFASVLSGADNYTYFEFEPLFTQSTGYFSSRSETQVRGKQTSMDVIEFYTEETASLRYGVSYIEEGKKWSKKNSVTRFSENGDTGEKNILSLTYNSGYTEVNTVHLTSTAYTSRTHIWHQEPSASLAESSAQSSYLDLTKSGNLYSGTLKQFWGGSFGDVYDYEIDTSTGTVSSSWAGSENRSLQFVNEIIDLKSLDSIHIALPGSPWSFSGYYEQNAFYGTYVHNGISYDVAVSSDGVMIDGIFHSYGE